MGRSARTEPLWPLVLMVGVVAGGLAIGAFVTRGSDSRAPAMTLASEGRADAPLLPTQRERVRVEVLNAGGIQGAAGEAKDFLRAAGFDVVYYGNAAAFGREVTLVLDRTGMEGAAEAVAGSLGAAELRYESDPTLLVDVTVLLGGDWRSLTGSLGGAGEGVGAGTGNGDTDRPWWDPRRLLDFLNETR